jgi:hypothetical protein
MPTKRGGYYLADGTRVPSVTTILGRYKESGALINWAWKLGLDGKDYREVRDAAANSGTQAHAAVEAFIHGEPYEFDMDSEIGCNAHTAFQAFLKWQAQTSLVVDTAELPLVSEKYKFGGTMDAVFIDGQLSMADWKTSGRLYPDHLAQIAAYSLLWEEAYPNRPLDGGYHLLRFDKRNPDFHHHHWGELEAGKRFFLHLRAAYEEEKELKQRAG